MIAHRKRLEGDPIIAVLENTLRDADAAARAHPDDAELRGLRDWLGTFLGFVRLFDRAVGLVPVVEPAELERILALLAKVPDETLLRLVRLLDELPDDDVAVARQRPEPAVSRRRPACHEAHVGRGPDRRAVGVARARGPGSPAAPVPAFTG